MDFFLKGVQEKNSSQVLGYSIVSIIALAPFHLTVFIWYDKKITFYTIFLRGHPIIMLSKGGGVREGPELFIHNGPHEQRGEGGLVRRSLLLKRGRAEGDSQKLIMQYLNSPSKFRRNKFNK